MGWPMMNLADDLDNARGWLDNILREDEDYPEEWPAMARLVAVVGEARAKIDAAIALLKDDPELAEAVRNERAEYDDQSDRADALSY